MQDDDQRDEQPDERAGFPPPLRLETVSEPGRVVVLAHGDVDSSTAAALGSVLAEAGAPGTARVELDLGSVGFMDSAGLNVLAAGIRLLRSHGGRLVVRAASPRVGDLIRVAGMADDLGLDERPFHDGGPR